MNYFDISYPMDSKMAIYPGNPPFHVERVLDVEKGDGVTVSYLKMGSHTGTHIDAPSHCLKNGETIDEIPLERMNGAAKVIDATGHPSIDVSFLRNYDIIQDDILLFKTDNSICWVCDSILNDYVTLTYEAAEYLAEKKIKLIGIDYLSIEIPRAQRSAGKSIHKILLSNSVIICEALRLRNIKPGDYSLVCLPLAVIGMDGCPARCILLK